MKHGPAAIISGGLRKQRDGANSRIRRDGQSAGAKPSSRGRGKIGLDETHTTFDVIDGLEPGETYTFALTAPTTVGDLPATATAPVAVQ